MVRIIALLAAGALCQAAFGQAVYKCTVDGKIEYGDRPCAGGEGVLLKVPAPGATPAEAAAAVQRERETLLALDKLRLAHEQQAQRERELALREERHQARGRKAADAQRLKCDKLRLHQKWSDEDRAHLAGPAAEAARVKARRQAEAMAVECPA
jgi:hypothetical protein